MILTCMGMAVGTGNIWRFPREVAAHGGGTFLIPWFIFLFLWSIPLLMVEFSIGKGTRHGPFGAFQHALGSKASWMGGFISICAMMIMCYYAVITGWTFRYVGYAVSGSLAGLNGEQTLGVFDALRGSSTAIVCHIAAVAVAILLVAKGARSIERVNKILIPTLIAILILGAIRSLTLDGASSGLAYLFHVEWHRLAEPGHWIAGLSQSAWSTGAGWGLMLSYSVYARDQDDPVTTPIATGLGNNFIEIMVGLMMFPAIFALVGPDFLADMMASRSQGGIAFQVAPILFSEMAGGQIIGLLFFLGLASAALTSLIAMMELSARFFQDFRLSRGTALSLTAGLCLVLGIPSALSDNMFDNQDFVWGVGLIVSGLFLALFVIHKGVNRFALEFLFRNRQSVPAWFPIAIGLIVVEALILMGWWLIAYPTYAIQCIWQWGLVVLTFFILRSRLVKISEDGA
ncbi:MAG: sodium-dependent transporter [Acidobacteria bacterium]|nr:sodium-dependent transporter [Acidobacteriota bacterium]